jgi:AcrR family transcriptional regulator
MPRTRSVRAHDDVIDAALRLFAARGIDATSVDAIAGASGVSKATIYKHWADKDALCLEAMSRITGDAPSGEPDDRGDLRAELLSAISQAPTSGHDSLRGRIMPHMMAYAARHPAFARAWQARFFEPRRQRIAQAIERAVGRGDIAAPASIDHAVAALIGPAIYAQILMRLHRDIAPGLPEFVIETFVRAHSTKPGSGRRSAGRIVRR